MSPKVINKESNQLFSTIGDPFIELIEVASTNSYAIAMVQANLAEHGTTYFAHKQTAGKGQRGKTWLAEPGSNIIVSSIIDSSALLINRQFMFSVCVSLAAYDFFSKYAGAETKIKWPNDIYWRDRKAGGILIENIIKGNSWNWAIVGIGININQKSFSEELKNPVSLLQITGKQQDAILLTKELCTFLECRFQQLKEGEDEALLVSYNQILYKRSEIVRLKQANIIFECRIKGINKYGQLLVADAIQDSFSFGEVEWVL